MTAEDRLRLGIGSRPWELVPAEIKETLLRQALDQSVVRSGLSTYVYTRQQPQGEEHA